MNRCARCDWAPSHEAEGTSRQQLEAHAADAEHWLCLICGQSQAKTDPSFACESCLSDTRGLLAGIVLLWQELPAHLRTVTGSALGGARSGADGPPLPGGSALALLGPGSAGGSARRLTRSDLANGVDGREHRHDNRPDDTPSVAWTLASWEDDLRHTRGDDPSMAGTGTSRVVHAAAAYLDTHCRWAANNHEAFAELHADLRDLHVALEVATHRRRRPTRLPADCFSCAGSLFRLVDPDTGLEDEHATCTACREQYDAGRYALALKAAAWEAAYLDVDGESWATPEALATDLKRSVLTIRSWRDRSLVRHLDRGGVSFVHVEDVTAKHGKKKTA